MLALVENRGHQTLAIVVQSLIVNIIATFISCTPKFGCFVTLVLPCLWQWGDVLLGERKKRQHIKEFHCDGEIRRCKLTLHLIHCKRTMRRTAQPKAEFEGASRV